MSVQELENRQVIVLLMKLIWKRNLLNEQWE